MMMRSTAIITGASKGIGRALTLNLASKGINVIAIARNEQELKVLQTEYPDYIHIVSADIGTDEGINSIVEKAKTFDKIDYLINNAAIIEPLKNLEDIDRKELSEIFNINVFAPMLLPSKLLSLLANGRILNISSSAEDFPTAGAGAYGITKAALKMITKLQQMEYQNIAVNSVIPGEVESNMQETLRHSNHPLKDIFHKAKPHLMPASTCAAFLAYLLLKVSREDFVNKKWDIYDLSHRDHWLEDNMPLPEPYACVQAKLNSELPKVYTTDSNHSPTLHVRTPQQKNESVKDDTYEVRPGF